LNVVVLFGTLKVQSFILADVSDCGWLIITTFVTSLNKKDTLEEKQTVSPNHQEIIKTRSPIATPLKL